MFNIDLMNRPGLQKIITKLNIDPNSIEEKISKNTKVILPVHFGGLSCELNLIQKIISQ